MLRFNKAIVKFNHGHGALLCNRCGHIIALGFSHKDKVHYCEECERRSERARPRPVIKGTWGSDRVKPR